MTLGLIFWILMLVWVVFSAWSYWPNTTRPGPVWADHFLLFVLFLLLGWGVFGAPVRG
jgi:hypothetical protein